MTNFCGKEFWNVNFQANIHKFLIRKESEEPKIKMHEIDKGSGRLEDKDTNTKTDCRNKVIHISQYSLAQ